MVNPSLDPTRPNGSELPTFSYGGEGIPRVLKQYRSSPYRYIFPIRWSNQPNQSERRLYVPLTWITPDPGNGLVFAWRQAIAWTNFHFIIKYTLRDTLQWFLVVWKKCIWKWYAKLWSSCLGLSVLNMALIYIATTTVMNPPIGYTCNRVNKAAKKLHFVTNVIITTMKTRCTHGNNMCSRPTYWLGCFKRHLSMKIWYPARW